MPSCQSDIFSSPIWLSPLSEFRRSRLNDVPSRLQTVSFARCSTELGTPATSYICLVQHAEYQNGSCCTSSFPSSYRLAKTASKQFSSIYIGPFSWLGAYINDSIVDIFSCCQLRNFQCTESIIVFENSLIY